ncbi:hypothetical protein Tco_0747737 [Tanacetum coccineum]|uniref:Uncharacterized protein n=1 Tax=Tanacetum coccineum TaxID=301880 RepID=A0ABQ4YW49_9ASTR
MYELLQMMQSFCEKLLEQKQAASIDQSPLQEMSIQDMEDLKQHYLDEMLSLSNDLQIKDYRNEKIDICFRRECESMIDELKGKFNGMSIEINKKKELQHLEQVANLSTYPSQRFKSFCYDDDDDYDYEESTIPLNEIVSQIPPDDESLSDEDVPKDVKIYSNPLFEFDDEYISSDVNPLFDEVLEDIECKDSYDSNLDESTFLVTPLSDSNEDEFFTPRDDVELLLHHDPSISIVSILEGFTDEPPFEENDDLFDLESKENDWKKILYDAPIDDLITEDKVFDPGIHEKSFSPTFVKLTFEDRHYFPITFVIRIFLPYLTYSVDSSFLLSSGSEDTIFDPSISAFQNSSLKPVAYENPIVIFPFFCIRGTVAIQVDWYEVSRSTRGSISLVDPAGDSLEAITPDLPIEEPDNSLSMGDEHLSTIPETESDELIKSSVEILVPIPSLEEVNDDHEEKEFDLEDILQIQDVQRIENKAKTVRGIVHPRWQYEVAGNVRWQYEVEAAGQSKHDTCPKRVIRGCQAYVSPRLSCGDPR